MPTAVHRRPDRRAAMRRDERAPRARLVAHRPVSSKRTGALPIPSPPPSATREARSAEDSDRVHRGPIEVAMSRRPGHHHRAHASGGQYLEAQRGHALDPFPARRLRIARRGLIAAQRPREIGDAAAAHAPPGCPSFGARARFRSPSPRWRPCRGARRDHRSPRARRCLQARPPRAPRSPDFCSAGSLPRAPAGARPASAHRSAAGRPSRSAPARACSRSSAPRWARREARARLERWKLLPLGLGRRCPPSGSDRPAGADRQAG